ncbi:MAG TPA: helix-turn-helix transcriptional regulator [Ohtaekwangia sp.]|uniref:helix-turn-helix transcriptional regulator n=1 Tax=Ohtaekwangia sp. TaxID=2066019 RepID=UPI002F9546C9
MKFTQLAPPPHLRAYVRYFWTLENDGDDTATTLGPLADGCPGFMVHPSEKGMFKDEFGNPLAPAFLYGQTITRTSLHLTGKFSTAGICFHPDALKSVFGFDAHEFTDSCFDTNIWSNRRSNSLEDQLLHAATSTEQLAILTTFITDEVRKNQVNPDVLTQQVVTRIMQSRGQITLRDLQQHFSISERSLERKFSQQVGITPKVFSRVCRFQASLQQLINNNYSNLSDVAFDNGYSDQSHFIRTFKEFAGTSPYQFQKQATETATTIPVLL